MKNEMSLTGEELNGPRTANPSFKAGNLNDYHMIRCTNIKTKQFVGYLAVATNNYANITELPKDAAKFKICFHGTNQYLEKDTSPNDRYLGVGVSDCACYGLWTPTGWVDAIIYDHSNQTISLAADTKRKLYFDGTYVKWSSSDGGANDNILAFEFV